MQPNQTVLLLLTFGLVFIRADTWDCRRAVCSFDVPPECQEWLTVDCDFGNEKGKLISLTAASFPKEAMEIYISNAQEVKLDKNSVKKLKSLGRIGLNNITTLLMYGNAMSRSSSSKELIVTISLVKDLTLYPESFSGCCGKNSKITVKDIKHCIIKKATFPANSLAETILLENIGSLRAEYGAFGADVKEITVKKVNMEKCKNGTFLGQFHSFTLRKTTMKNVMGGCVTANRHWKTFHVIQCNFSRIETFGFQGDIEEKVCITDSNMIFVDTKGFSIKTSLFKMSQNAIGELEYNAIDIEFEQSVQLDEITIKKMRKYALHLISVEKEGKVQNVNISNLYIEHGEDKSFAVALKDNLVISHIVIKQTCFCSIKGRIEQMFGHVTQHGVDAMINSKMQSLVSQVYCEDEVGSETSIRDYQIQKCSFARINIPSTQTFIPKSDTLGFSKSSPNTLPVVSKSTVSASATRNSKIITFASKSTVLTSTTIASKDVGLASEHYLTLKSVTIASGAVVSTTINSVVTVFTHNEGIHPTKPPSRQDDLAVVYIKEGGAAEPNIALYVSLGAISTLAVVLLVALVIYHRRQQHLEDMRSSESGGQRRPSDDWTSNVRRRPPASPPVSTAPDYTESEAVTDFSDHYYEEIPEQPPSERYATVSVGQESARLVFETSFNENQLYAKT